MALLGAVILFFLLVACCLELGLGIAKMTKVQDISPVTGNTLPKVSIIIPACNEETTIEPALLSVLNLGYPNFEVIVVNDRSTDDTATVIKKVQQSHPHLQTFNISNLPENWLGKNYALHHGAQKANGAYLLFSDADIIMEKTVLCRAMRKMLTDRLDHLSMLFENTAKGGFLNGLMMEAGGGLMMLFKPWRARERGSKYFMGVGAFNLVKASSYREVGGHASFAMHPIDDIMLGKVLKSRGFRQDCLHGMGHIKVAWYDTVRELINGVMKNTFALYHYNILRVVFYVFTYSLFAIVPFWAGLLTEGVIQIVFCSMVLIRLVSFTYGFTSIGLAKRNAFWSLITPYVNIYIMVRATAITIINNGIEWRGTHYPLEKLTNQDKLLP